MFLTADKSFLSDLLNTLKFFFLLDLLPFLFLFLVVAFSSVPFDCGTSSFLFSLMSESNRGAILFMVCNSDAGIAALILLRDSSICNATMNSLRID